jgi:hypothetical protein
MAKLVPATKLPAGSLNFTVWGWWQKEEKIHNRNPKTLETVHEFLHRTVHSAEVIHYIKALKMRVNMLSVRYATLNSIRRSVLRWTLFFWYLYANQIREHVQHPFLPSYCSMMNHCWRRNQRDINAPSSKSMPIPVHQPKLLKPITVTCTQCVMVNII